MIDSHVHIHKQPYNLETIENMVKNAELNGINEIWVVDHTSKFIEFDPIYEPMKKYPRGIKAFFKQQKISVREYIDFINEVKKHEYPVKIRFGLEVCYFQETEDVIKELLKKYPFEIRIGSVHHVFGMPYDIDPTYWSDFNVDDVYHQYYQENFAAINSGLFTHLGHPDAIKIFHFYPSYDLTEEYEKLARLLHEHNLPTENNSGFVRYGFKKLGLNDQLKEILRKNKVKILTSSDAHEASYIGYSFKTLLK